jgi:hypothetical protein
MDCCRETTEPCSTWCQPMAENGNRRIVNEDLGGWHSSTGSNLHDKNPELRDA